MPISRKNFDVGNFERKNTDRWNHPISVLLRKNTNLAYTTEEIKRKVKLSIEGIRGMLHNLQKMGYVVHKQPYYAWKKGAKEKQ